MGRTFHFGYYQVTFIASILLSVIFGLLSSSFQIELLWKEKLLTFSWFVCFYWLPLWASGYAIFKLRKHGKDHFLAELFILWMCLHLGYLLKLTILTAFIDNGSFVWTDGLEVSISWALIFYSLARTYEYSKMVISSKIDLHKAKIETLRYQLNPHLLFNSLNTISVMIHTEPEKADKILHDLAALLRFSLELSDKERITLEAELDLVERYINIEKARFGDLLSITRNIEQECLHCLLPPLLIQTLVENAVKHNNKNKPLHIDVDVSIQQEKLHIVVSDNGVGFPAAVLNFETGERVGLKNIRTQIMNIVGSSIHLANTENDANTGAIATVSIAQ